MDSDAVRIPLATDLKTSISDNERRAPDQRAFGRRAAAFSGSRSVQVAWLPGGISPRRFRACSAVGLLYMIYNDEFEIVDVDNPPRQRAKFSSAILSAATTR
jgi:hypothetical protein